MVTAPADLVRSVDDPELPHVTIGDLGMVRTVDVTGRTVHVRIAPTYTGCPATDQIRADVETALQAAGYEPTVEFVMAPAWSTDDISTEGRAKLRAAGIAPPGPHPRRPRPDRPPRHLCPLRVTTHPARGRVRRHRLQVAARLRRLPSAVRVVQDDLIPCRPPVSPP